MPEYSRFAQQQSDSVFVTPMHQSDRVEFLYHDLEYKELTATVQDEPAA